MSRLESLPGIGPDYTSQFFHGDSVTRRGDQSAELYVVLRCWAEDDLPDIPPGTAARDVDRPLKRGEVGISAVDNQEQLIVAESDIELWSREVYLGDTVKLSLASIESARVIETRQEVQIGQTFGEKFDAWIPSNRLLPSTIFQKGSRVIYNNWVGTVEGVLNLGMVMNDCGTMCKVFDPFGLAMVGDPIQDVFDKFECRGIAPFVKECGHCGFPVERNFDYVAVVAVKIMWNAINQKLPTVEQKDWPQPQQYFTGKDMYKLCRAVHGPEVMFPLEFTCFFRDAEDYKRYGIEATHTVKPPGLEIWALSTKRTRTILKLQWQDGTITDSCSTDVVPYSPMLSTDCWPGDHIMWSDDDGRKRPAIVQKWNARQRTLDLMFPDTQEKQGISALELDDTSAEQCGVRLSTEVLLCDDNETPSPQVPTIGQNRPLGDPMIIMDHMDSTYVENDDKDLTLEKMLREQWGIVPPDVSHIDWYGQVKGLRQDGRVDVRLGNGKLVTVELKNIYRMLPPPISSLLGPGLEDEDDGDDSMLDAMFDMGPVNMGPMPMSAVFFGPGGQFIVGADQGVSNGPSLGMGPFDPINFFGPLNPSVPHAPAKRKAETASEKSWETTDDEAGDEDWSSDDEMEANKDDADQEVHPNEPEPLDRKPDETTDQDAMDIEEVDPQLGGSPARSTSSLPEPSAKASSSRNSASHEWVSFDICEAAPLDHRFIGQAPAESSRSRMSRLNKEHKALRTSLPDNILVRSYEDRTDLLRVLILGPEGTPYSGAPFVFDVFLHSGFPTEPPKVHFHSHTNGKGRCNPNLYEDGKVCLSILGTWQGDASESWQSSKSSLLQVFVSISGLVLVKHPYHCEPAFSKLEGTKEGLVNSRQYSEKAYILSRSFVRQALLHPPASLQKELEKIYLTDGRLKSVISHARTLMDKEDDQGEEDEGADRWDSDAIGSLSIGAKISLKRTLEALENIWTEHEAKMASA